ncbi:hypothetical protein FHC47_19255, partial [Klebsiella quasipneumoniae]
MVFYMLNKIADYAPKVVMNFVHQRLFQGTMLRRCPGYRFAPCAGVVSAARPWVSAEYNIVAIDGRADSKKAPLGRLFTLVGRAG